jgi:hypothetical protein
VKQMRKEEETRATDALFPGGPWFKSEGVSQLPISPMMGRKLTPFVMSHDRVKIGQPPRLPQRIVGRGRMDVTRRRANKCASVQPLREQVPRSWTTADGRVAAASRFGLGAGSSRGGQQYAAGPDLEARYFRIK